MSTRTMGWALALVLGTACSATGGGSAVSSSSSAARLRVELIDYTSDRHFELASESHTDRLEYYSEVRTEAARKVQADEVLQALMEELERNGYRRHATPGRAPSSGSRVIRRGLEVEADGSTSSWLVGEGTEVEERKDFNACMDAFFQLYNISASWQTIETENGADFFQRPRPDR